MRVLRNIQIGCFSLNIFQAKTIKQKKTKNIHTHFKFITYYGSKTNRSDLQTIIIFFSSLLKLKMLCTKRQEQSRAVCMWQTMNCEKKRINNKSMRLVRCNGILGWLVGSLVGMCSVQITLYGVECRKYMIWSLWNIHHIEYSYTPQMCGQCVPLFLFIPSPFVLNITHGLGVRLLI